MSVYQRVCGMALAGLIAASVSATQTKAETVLNLSSWMPAGHANVAGGIVPWTQEVEKATEGRVRINVLNTPLGKPAAHFDMAESGIADITFGVQGYQPGRFVTSKAVELPFLGGSAESISVAYWRIFEKHLKQAGEYNGVKVLGVYTHGPGQIFNNVRPITSLEDLQGVKIRVGGGVITQTADALGIEALHKPANEVYTLLSSGVIDGVAFPKETVKSYNISDFIKYATIIPGGFYNVSWFLVMNQDKFDQLSEADQKAVMSVSGEHFARMVGRAWDEADANAVEFMKEKGIQVDVAPDEFVSEMKERTRGVEEAWYEEIAKKGLDGRAIMEDLRAEIGKIEAEMSK